MDYTALFLPDNFSTSSYDSNLRDSVLVPPEVAEVRAGDVPHVDGRVVAGGEQQPPRQRGRHAREARVRGRGLVLLDLLVTADIPQPEIELSTRRTILEHSPFTIKNL